MILLGAFLLLLLAACSSTLNSSEDGGSTDSEQSIEQQEEFVMYLVRHGQTWFNTTGQIQGFSDSPLTENGISQATQVGKGMADIDFVTAYSSDLGRQRTTANLILEENDHEVPPLKELYGLREWNYGSFEGRDESDSGGVLLEQHGFEADDEWTYWNDLIQKLGNEGLANAYEDLDPEGAAENYEQIRTRAQEAIDTIEEETLNQGGGNVLIVSSGSQISVILEMLAPEEYSKEDELGNGSVSILTYKDGEYALDIVGDNSFLESAE